MPKKREIAWRVEWEDEDSKFVAHSQTTPLNEYEALMQVPPHVDALVSREEQLPIREAIQDALDELDPLERRVFDDYFIRRVPLRQLAEELGRSKSGIAVIRDRATAKLRQKLQTDPLLEGYLK